MSHPGCFSEQASLFYALWNKPYICNWIINYNWVGFRSPTNSLNVFGSFFQDARVPTVRRVHPKMLPRYSPRKKKKNEWQAGKFNQEWVDVFAWKSLPQVSPMILVGVKIIFQGRNHHFLNGGNDFQGYQNGDFPESLASFRGYSTHPSRTGVSCN